MDDIPSNFYPTRNIREPSSTPPSATSLEILPSHVDRIMLTVDELDEAMTAHHIRSVRVVCHEPQPFDLMMDVKRLLGKVIEMKFTHASPDSGSLLFSQREEDQINAIHLFTPPRCDLMNQRRSMVLSVSRLELETPLTCELYTIAEQWRGPEVYFGTVSAAVVYVDFTDSA